MIVNSQSFGNVQSDIASNSNPNDIQLSDDNANSDITRIFEPKNNGIMTPPENIVSNKLISFKSDTDNTRNKSKSEIDLASNYHHSQNFESKIDLNDMKSLKTDQKSRVYSPDLFKRSVNDRLEIETQIKSSTPEDTNLDQKENFVYLKNKLSQESIVSSASSDKSVKLDLDSKDDAKSAGIVKDHVLMPLIDKLNNLTINPSELELKEVEKLCTNFSEKMKIEYTKENYYMMYPIFKRQFLTIDF